MWFKRLKPRPDLYLHIGQPKSGTTSIQDFLALERDHLYEQGFLYPRLENVDNSNAHHALSYELREWGEKGLRIAPHDCSREAAVWDQLDSILARNPVSNVILSSEDFYFLDASSRWRQNAVSRLGAWAAKRFRTITIIVYLRRQDEHIESWCNELVKHGRNRTILDMASLAETLPRCHSDYNELRARWATVFGEDSLVLRSFDRSQLKNGNVIDDFCDFINYRPSQQLFGFDERNRRLTRLGFEIVRHANRFEHSLPVHKRIVKLLQDSGAEASMDPGAAARYLYFNEKLRQKWRHSNQALPLNFVDPLFEAEEGPVRPYCLWQDADLLPVTEIAEQAMGSDDRCNAAAGAVLAAAINVMRAS